MTTIYHTNSGQFYATTSFPVRSTTESAYASTANGETSFFASPEFTSYVPPSSAYGLTETLSNGYHPQDIQSSGSHPGLSNFRLSEQAIPFNPTEMLYVTPGQPTPIELCIYDNKLPSGVLHVTESQQTIEFLHGVANLPV